MVTLRQGFLTWCRGLGNHQQGSQSEPRQRARSPPQTPSYALSISPSPFEKPPGDARRAWVTAITQDLSHVGGLGRRLRWRLEVAALVKSVEQGQRRDHEGKRY